MINSKNKYDVYMWVKQVAASARTADQKQSAARLISNFQRQFNLLHTDAHMYNETSLLQFTTSHL